VKKLGKWEATAAEHASDFDLPNYNG